MILISGAAGFLGRALVGDLVSRPTVPDLRAFVRSEFDAVLLRDQGIEAVTGDSISRRGLDRAIQGVETLVYLEQPHDRPGDVVANTLEAVQNAMIAARAAGVSRIIFLGAVGASESATSRLLLAQWAAELAVRQSGLSWVILRTPLIVGAGSTSFEVLRRLVNRTPIVPTFSWRRTEVEPVALPDVIEACRQTIESPELDERSFDVCGPDRWTVGQLIREWARVAGKRRMYLPLPGAGERLGTSLAVALTRLPRRETRLALEALRDRQVCVDPSQRFPFPHRPQSLRTALAEVYNAE